MTTKKPDRRRCVGCTDNFYNGNNDLGVKECWRLKDAKLVKRLRVPINQPPPFKMPAESVYDCRREKGYAMVKPENIGRGGFWQ